MIGTSLLARIAAFCRWGSRHRVNGIPGHVFACGLLLLFMVAAGSNLFDDAAEARTPPVSISFAELGKAQSSFRGADVSLAGVIHPELFFEYSEGHRYYLLEHDGHGILISPDENRRWPSGLSRFTGRLKELPSKIRGALDERGDTLGDVPVYSGAFLQVGSSASMTPQGKTLSYAFLTCGMIFLALLAQSMRLRHVVFRSEKDSPTLAEARLPERLRVTGQFQLGSLRHRFFEVPVLLAQSANEEWAFVSPVDASTYLFGQRVQDRAGLWAVPFRPSCLAQATPGTLFCPTARPALRFRTDSGHEVVVSFETAAERDEFRQYTREPEPSAGCVAPDAEPPGELPASPPDRQLELYRWPADRSLKGIPSSCVGIFGAALLLGVVFHFIEHLYSLFIVSELLLGVALGMLCLRWVQRCKARNTLLLGAAMVLASVLCLGTHYWLEAQELRPAMVQAFSRDAPRQEVEEYLTPVHTFQMAMQIFAAQGVTIGRAGHSSDGALSVTEGEQREQISPGGDFTISGRWYWLFLLGQVAVVAWIAAATLTSVAFTPYCSSCGREHEALAVRLTGIENFRAVCDVLRAGHWNALVDLPRPRHGQPLQVELMRCPGCQHAVINAASYTADRKHVAFVVPQGEVEAVAAALRATRQTDGK